MKRFFLFLGCILTWNTYAQTGEAYLIEGKIGAYDAPAKIHLQYIENEQVVSQSSPLQEGKFSFSGQIKTPSLGRLVITLDGSPVMDGVKYKETLTLIIANEQFNILSDESLANAVITGSKSNDDMSRLNAQETTANSLDELDTIYKNFIRSNPDSFVSLLLLQEYGIQAFSTEEMKALYNPLSDYLKNTDMGKMIGNQILSVQRTAIGSAAPDFTQNDPEGNPVKLSDFRGKYLLLDFWASWCGPCRRENPNVVKAYERYKDKNFEILGVSLDNPGNRERWLSAIQSDGLTWKQVSDLKGWKNSVAVLYNVLTIPQNFLLDPNGVIIAKNLRGEDLNRTLATILE
jgi:peroxiredoxin